MRLPVDSHINELKHEAKLKILEKCEHLADLLIPGDPSLGLVGLSQIIRVSFFEDADFETLARTFVIEIEDFLGHEIGAKEVRIGQLEDYLKSPRDGIRLFLLKILEIYYTDDRVLKFYPHFSGNIFPNYRRLPTLKIEMLEHVVSVYGDLED
jgi:hypothetical protein